MEIHALLKRKVRVPRADRAQHRGLCVQTGPHALPEHGSPRTLKLLPAKLSCNKHSLSVASPFPWARGDLLRTALRSEDLSAQSSFLPLSIHRGETSILV